MDKTEDARTQSGNSVNSSRNSLVKSIGGAIARQQQSRSELSTQLSPSDTKELMQNIGQVSGSMIQAITESLKGAGGEAEFTERITIKFE